MGLFVVPAATVLARWRRTVAIASVRGCADAWVSPRAAVTATLVFGRALPQIDVENGGGFFAAERVLRFSERCGGAGSRSSEIARACTLASFRDQSSGAAEYCVSCRSVCIGSCCRIAATRNLAELLQNPRFLALPQRGTRKAQDSFLARTQRYATRHSSKPCSRQPCAAPPRKAVAC